MMVNKNGYLTFLNLAVLLTFAGFMSLTVYGDRVNGLIWPTIVLLVALYMTNILIYKILNEQNLLFSIVTFMLVLGWLVLLRIEPALALRQLVWIILGCIFVVLLLRFLFIFSNDLILRYKLYWLFLTFILLAMPLLFGITVGGATSWLEICGLRFQPSEGAKVTFFVFLAAWFKDNSLGLSKTWVAWLGTFVSICLLVLQRDLGTALVFYLVFLLLLYLATGKLKDSAIGLVLLVIGAVLAYQYFPHVRVRAMSWLNPWLDPDQGGYQILQSLFAFANGGLGGTGFGGGMPQVIPEAHTDFVFAVIGEQLGILGTIGVVILYLFFAFFSLKKAQLIPTLGSRLLAAGLSLVLIVQAFIIMGGVTKLIPLTGLPLPFMSYGGSSTISNFVMLGVIMWLSKEKSFVPAVSRRRLIYINRLIWGMFLALILNLTYWQVLAGGNLLEHPLNPRWRQVEKVTERGFIYGNDRSLLAGGTNKVRIYPLKEAAAHLVGYSSVQYGKTGLESALDKYLLAIPDLTPGFIPEDRQGWDVYTTIDPRLQALAWDLHKENIGASIVLDVNKGDVLALVSSPSFDPNHLAEHWNLLKDSQNNKLFNRATQGLYPPGSVFKMISGAALLKLKPELRAEELKIPSQIEADGYVISDLIKKDALTFAEAIGFSSNIYFIESYLDYDWNVIKQELEKSFRISADYSIPALPVAQAALGEVVDKADIAATVIGQGEVLVTPMHMAVWAGAIAKGGLILQPRIIDKIVNTATGQEEKPAPVVMGSACSKEVAQIILDGMALAVNSGTAQNAKLPGVNIGGKTGSAENNHGITHAWFVGIAPIENPRIVVVTLVENGGRGGEAAAPIARLLLKAALD
ncbi:MAG: FtsW/RodA/SpoVE family cell cycle protein [Peptococcaceae bacterium]